MAQAVQELFPQAKLGIGPPVENGFYYDFDVPTPFTPDDLGKLEKKMQQIIKERQRVSRRGVSADAERTEPAAEPYKPELIVRELDLDKIREVRDRWAFYRDRRPDAYDPIVAR